MKKRGRASGPDDPAPAARIALWGNFGTLNFGNECTLAAAIDNLRKRLPDAQWLCVCSEPHDAAARHGIPAVPMAAAAGAQRRGPKPLRVLRTLRIEAADWLRTLRVASKIDALLIIGTGILTDYGEGTLGFPYQLFKWCLSTRLRGGKVLFVSVGAESISQRLPRFFLKSALRVAAYRGYRDEHSASLLRACGFRTDQDPIVPDLAFSLPPVMLASAAASAPQRRVAVGLFNYRGRGLGSPLAATQYAAYVELICALISWLLGHGYAVRVIIGDLAYDESVREDVRARLQARGLDLTSASFTDAPAASYEELLTQLATVDCVIASRFHNVLLALLLGKPVVSVSYEAKNEALMQQMGLGRFCQTLDELDLGQLIGQFLELEKNAEALRETIAVRVAANRARLELQYDAIVASVSGT